jgi:hypothetical protein
MSDFFILTESLHGDEGEGKLAVIGSSKSLSQLKKRRDEILRLRVEKPLFGKMTKKQIEQMNGDLRIWKLAV